MQILNEPTPREALRAFLFCLDVWVTLYKLIPEYQYASHIYETDEAWDYVDLTIKKLDGRPSIKQTITLDKRILIIRDEPNNPAAGCLLMKYAWCEEANAILYWTTKMLSLYFNQEMKHDTPKTS